MVGLLDALSDRELQPAVREVVDGDGGLREDRRTARTGFATRGPIRTLFVSSAIAASAVQPSNQGREAARVWR